MSDSPFAAAQMNPDEVYTAMLADLENLNDLMLNFSNAVIIQVAMDEEIAPLLNATAWAQEPIDEGAAVFHPRTLTVNQREVPLLLVRSKIGLVNAASAVTEALSYATDCSGVISAGTAGGLAATTNVGDVIVGTEYTYTDADASAFGYVRGQIPGMPETYGGPDSDVDDAVAAAVEALDAEQTEGGWQVCRGLMLAGHSFVTAHNVKDTREAFPAALSTDMETTAIAQVCHNYEVPFVAVRCVSDLCGPAAGQDFHLGVEVAAARSAQYALRVAAHLWFLRGYTDDAEETEQEFKA